IPFPCDVDGVIRRFGNEHGNLGLRDVEEISAEREDVYTFLPPRDLVSILDAGIRAPVSGALKPGSVLTGVLQSETRALMEGQGVHGIRLGNRCTPSQTGLWLRQEGRQRVTQQTKLASTIGVVGIRLADAPGNLDSGFLVRGIEIEVVDRSEVVAFIGRN